MAGALWLVGGLVFVVVFGTWAIQIVAWAVVLAMRAMGLVTLMIGGLLATLALAIWDRPALDRIWRSERASADIAPLSAREQQT